MAAAHMLSCMSQQSMHTKASIAADGSFQNEHQLTKATLQMMGMMTTTAGVTWVAGEMWRAFKAGKTVQKLACSWWKPLAKWVRLPSPTHGPASR